MNHHFGATEARDLGPGERLCTEPAVSGAAYACVYHAVVEERADDDVVCLKCGASFREETAA